MKRILCGIFLLFSLSITLASSETPKVQVLLFEGPMIPVGGTGQYILDGRTMPPEEHVMTAQNGLVVSDNQLLKPQVAMRSVSPLFYLTANGKPYRGIFFLKVSSNGLKLINEVSLEEYLYGVVAKEMPGSDLEALKAQAVASRTLAANAFARGKSMRPTVSQQLYAGVDGERPITNEAVDETRGMVLTYQGALAAYPLFSSTCGGETEDNADVFGKRVPYLTSVPDADEAGGSAFCSLSPYFSWSVTWDSEQLQQNFEASGIRGDLLDLVPDEMDGIGHVKELLIRTTQGEWRIRGEQIRSVLKLPDGKPLYSTWFTISKAEENGRTQYTAAGHGKGHGVGLCQWGAIGMARQGKNFQDILKHYYPGTDIADSERLLGTQHRAPVKDFSRR